MNNVLVDDEVLAAVWQRANPRPFEALTFNAAMRRILGIDVGGTPAAPIDIPATPSIAPVQLSTFDRTRARKAELEVLVQAGLLRPRQTLFLIDYQGQRIPNAEALLSGSMLEFKGRHFSMSALARELLQQHGYKSEAVRGPAHWATEDGLTIKDLWERFLRRT
jgi:hypothetical protein